MDAYLSATILYIAVSSSANNLTEYNGFFIEGPTVNGKTSYTKTTANTDLTITWDGSSWLIEGTDAGNPVTIASSTDDVLFPWLVTNWSVSNPEIEGSVYVFQTPLKNSNLSAINTAATDATQEELPLVNLDGLYIFDGYDAGGWPRYYNSDYNVIVYRDAGSLSWAFSGTNSSLYYPYTDISVGGNIDAAFPWLQLDFPKYFDINGYYTGTVVEVPVLEPASPTFGLGGDVVALLVDRFGTVANFLRLRNQGQV
jgi:hypothetical protein